MHPGSPFPIKPTGLFFNLKFHSVIGASHNLYLRSIFIDGIKSFHIKADKYKRIFLALLNSYILLEHPQ